MKKFKTPKENRIKKVNMLPILIVVATILVIYAITILLLLGWGLLTSLKTYNDFVNNQNILGLPDVVGSTAYWNSVGSSGKSRADMYGSYNIFINYKLVLNSFNMSVKPQSYISTIWGEVGANRAPYQAGFANYIFNTFFYAFLGSFLTSFCCMTVAYAANKYRFKFSTFLYVFFLIMMSVPLVGVQTSTVALLKEIGIYDTYWAMFLMASASVGGLYFFVFYGHFQGLSNTYIEAAEIDGASQLGTYIRIIVPLSLKLFGTIYLLNFIALWNNYDAPMLYYPSEPTLAYAIYKMSLTTDGSQRSIDTQNVCTRTAGCMILALPVLVLFIALKDVIMGNLSMGGLKE